jgi:hypothetical protein
MCGNLWRSVCGSGPDAGTALHAIILFRAHQVLQATTPYYHTCLESPIPSLKNKPTKPVLVAGSPASGEAAETKEPPQKLSRFSSLHLDFSVSGILAEAIPGSEGRPLLLTKAEGAAHSIGGQEDKEEDGSSRTDAAAASSKQKGAQQRPVTYSMMEVSSFKLVVSGKAASDIDLGPHSFVRIRTVTASEAGGKRMSPVQALRWMTSAHRRVLWCPFNAAMLCTSRGCLLRTAITPSQS